MQLAINYSPQAANLITQKQIHADVFKCPDWPDVIAKAHEHLPVYVHFPIHAGCHHLDNQDWDRITQMMQETNTAFINVHMAPNANDFPGLDINTQESVWFDQLLETMLDDINIAVKRFGKERIILENVPWDPDPKYAIPRPAILPEFAQQAVRESGCGFLLDTAHAFISAHHLGMDPLDYLDQLPGEAIQELHICGTTLDQTTGNMTDHVPMRELDWPLVDYVLQQFQEGCWRRPQITALEYGGVGPLFEKRSDPDAILRDMTLLHSKFHPITTTDR